MTNTFTRAHLLGLHAVTPAADAPFTLPSGKAIPLRGASVTEYVLHVVREVESVADTFVAPAQAVSKLTAAEIASTAGEDGKPDEDKVSALIVSKLDVDTMLRRGAMDQVIVDGKFVAICMGYGGDGEIEASVLTWPEADFDAAVAEAEFRTWGIDPGPFFEGVQRRTQGLTRGERPTPSTTSRRSRKTTTSPSTAKGRRKA